MASTTLNWGNTGCYSNFVGSGMSSQSGGSNGNFQYNLNTSSGNYGYRILIIDLETVFGATNITINSVKINGKARAQRSGGSGLATLGQSGTGYFGYATSSSNVIKEKELANVPYKIGSFTDTTKFSVELTASNFNNNKFTYNGKTCVGIAIGSHNNADYYDMTHYWDSVSIAIEYTPHTHSYTSSVTKQPTCTTAGETTYSCSCGDSYVDKTIPAALGHSPGSAATCTTAQTCTRCGVTLANALGHSFGSTTAAKAATCIATGNTAYKKCSRCNLYFAGDAATNSTAGKSDTSSFVTAKNPNNHSGGTEVRNATSATCTATGYTGDTYCKGCGAKISSGSTIAKKEHTAVNDAEVAATCTTDGKTAGSHCSVCNTVITAQQTIPALGHSYASQVIAATAAVDGYTLHTCKNGCGSSYKDNYTINKIFFGTKQPSEIFYGTQKVKEVYYGTTKVFGPK